MEIASTVKMTRRSILSSSKDIVNQHESHEGVTAPLVQLDVRPPSRYKVILHNDDYTPMDFVIEILETVFHKTNALATQIMLDVHEKGLGICGVYPYEIAETKVTLVNDKAKQLQHPLKCTMEEE